MQPPSLVPPARVKKVILIMTPQTRSETNTTKLGCRQTERVDSLPRQTPQWQKKSRQPPKADPSVARKGWQPLKVDPSVAEKGSTASQGGPLSGKKKSTASLSGKGWQPLKVDPHPVAVVTAVMNPQDYHYHGVGPGCEMLPRQTNQPNGQGQSQILTQIPLAYYMYLTQHHW